MRAAFSSLAALLLLSVGSAQEDRWTVQTAAFKDYRQASAQVDELRDLGFDAYSEFAMAGGQQFARVRIGCFQGRGAAEEFASDMSGAFTAEAVPQRLSEGASATACVEWDVGFLKPRTWSIVRRQPDILFRVEVAGQVGYLRHAGEEWEFSHAAPDPVRSLASDSTGFREVRRGGVTLVQAIMKNGDRINVCSGKLLWQGGLTAVVERSESVIACRIDHRPVAGSR